MKAVPTVAFVSSHMPNFTDRYLGGIKMEYKYYIVQQRLHGDWHDVAEFSYQEKLPEAMDLYFFRSSYPVRIIIRIDQVLKCRTSQTVTSDH